MRKFHFFPNHRAHAAAFGFFLAIAVLITWPLVTVLSTHFAGYRFGDAHEMTRQIWWFKYALSHGQPLIFQPLLGYPDGIPGVILWSDPLQFFPAWLFAFIVPLPAAYNLQNLLNLALNGWAAYYLMWKLSGQQRFPALVAGVVFMASPVMQGHLAGGHGGLLVQWPLPLLAWALINLRADVGARHALPLRTLFPAILFFVLLPMGHTLQLIYAGLPLIGVFGLTLLVRREWRALARLAAVLVIGSAILLLFLLPVFQDTLGTAAYAQEGGGVKFSIDLLGIVTPSFNHPVYGQWDYTHRVLGINIVEGSSYIGIIVAVLAFVGIWKAQTARWWLLLAFVVWVLALGPLLKVFDQPVQFHGREFNTYITLPWAWVSDLPGFNLARTPVRFGFVLALALAVMAGYGVGAISRTFGGFAQQSAISQKAENSPSKPLLSLIPHPSYLIPIFLIAAILFDYQSFWPLPTYSAEIPQAVRDLSAQQDVRAVLDIPWENVLAAKDALWLQTAHEKPLIAGQVTRQTPVSPAKLTVLEQTLDPALLDAAGADVVILHKQYDSDGKFASLAQRELGAPFYQDDRLAMYALPGFNRPPQVTVVFPSGKTLSGSPILDSDILQPGADRAVMYVYVPENGWLGLDIRVNNPIPTAVLSLDGQPMYQRDISPFSDNLYLPFAQPGYHTVTLAVQPACPAYHEAIWQCGFGRETSLGVHDFVPAPLNQLVQLDHGVRLNGVYMDWNPEALALYLTLWWQFEQPRSDQDIRFVKVLDENNNQVAGVDFTLGPQPADSQMIDLPALSPGELPPGTYRVCIGWYAYPDLTRFAVLSDVPGAQDGLACIGEFTIP
jgi:hypothetical protein